MNLCLSNITKSWTLCAMKLGVTLGIVEWASLKRRLGVEKQTWHRHSLPERGRWQGWWRTLTVASVVAVVRRNWLLAPLAHRRSLLLRVLPTTSTRANSTYFLQPRHRLAFSRPDSALVYNTNGRDRELSPCARERWHMREAMGGGGIRLLIWREREGERHVEGGEERCAAGGKGKL
jgi:hypothetical protein